MKTDILFGNLDSKFIANDRIQISEDNYFVCVIFICKKSKYWCADFITLENNVYLKKCYNVKQTFLNFE